MGYLQSVLGKNLEDIAVLVHIEGEALAKEYRLQISANPTIVEGKTSGNEYIKTRVEILDENAFDVYHNVFFPLPHQDDKEQAATNTRFLEFCSCFGLDPDFEVEQFDGVKEVIGWQGAVGSCILKYVDDGEFPAKNEIGKLLTGPTQQTQSVYGAADLEAVEEEIEA